MLVWWYSMKGNVHVGLENVTFQTLNRMNWQKSEYNRMHLACLEATPTREAPALG